MKNFESITEKELLYTAYHNLLDRLYEEDERNNKHKELYGRNSVICVDRILKLDMQLKEIQDRLLEIEHAEYARTKPLRNANVGT